MRWLAAAAESARVTGEAVRVCAEERSSDSSCSSVSLDGDTLIKMNSKQTGTKYLNLELTCLVGDLAALVEAGEVDLELTCLVGDLAALVEAGELVLELTCLVGDLAALVEAGELVLELSGVEVGVDSFPLIILFF